MTSATSGGSTQGIGLDKMNVFMAKSEAMVRPTAPISMNLHRLERREALMTCPIRRKR